ncbi:response regulator [Alteromonas sp. ASW11-130]|uniref:response regulator n=1 Tax=Alteromonas sp. ASW11-130 TaxID=3015775 RepID=UPI0022420B34|nr:response regulator [Alteromonas sp. ASW11-130]MCW8091381.1 response regulator [Alteromonas sp. ASW11-130]
MNHKLAEKMRVLIIDDQVLAKGYLKYSLEQLGFQNIDYVEKSSQAITALRSHYYDLVICAYDLKEEREGYFLYEQLKDNKELPATSAFVFISADTSADIVHSIVELQPDEFLAKPFTIGDLDKRLNRVLKRKQALKPIYQALEEEKLEHALAEIESFLTEPKHAEFFPLALKLKGETLLACELIEQAKDFYQAIINVQNFNWAQIGLIKTFILLDQDNDAEKLILELALSPDASLMAYDLLSGLQIKLHEFDDALESVSMATAISPHNIKRHETALDLSRITHDYESQYDAAKRIVKFAKNSIHDKPEIYLNVARASIDFAMTAEEKQTNQLIKQATDSLRQMKNSFPKANVDDEVKVIDARIMYLRDEKDNAKALLHQLNDDTWEQQSNEALLDKAKAFHEVGLQEHALNILDVIERRCQDDPQQSELFLQYVQQEKLEKTEIKHSPKDLNNFAVIKYKRGDLTTALKTFRQAFTIMPKNPSIALNLLQATAMELRGKDRIINAKADVIIYQCMKTIEEGKLTQEQEHRYQRIKNILADLH